MASDWLAAVLPANQMIVWNSLLISMDFNMGISIYIYIVSQAPEECTSVFEVGVIII